MDISLIVLTYNRSQLLKECLLSLIDQDYPNDRFEIIVCDDGSRDNTKDVVSRFLKNNHNMRYLYQDHRGISAARNLGIKNSHGQFISFIADDYILDKDYVKTVINFFRQYPEANVMRFKIINKNNNFIAKLNHFCYESYIKDKLDSIENISKSYHLPPSGGAVFRKEIFEKIGLFDENLKRGEDSDIGRRLNKIGIGIYYYPLPFVNRIYESSLYASLKRHFIHGQNLHFLKQKHPDFPITSPDSIKNTLILIGGAFIYSIRKCLKSKRLINFFKFLPFMILFDFIYILGVFHGLRNRNER